MIPVIPDSMLSEERPMHFILTDHGDNVMHGHKFAEVFYIISGSIGHRIQGERTQTLCAGDMVIIPQGVAHTFVRTADTVCVHRDIEISEELFKEVCGFVGAAAPGTQVIRLSQETVRRFERRIDRLTLPVLASVADILPLMRTFCVSLIEQAVFADTESAIENTPAWLKRLIDAFDDPVLMREGLDSIVAHVEYDRKYLCKVFKKKTGLTMTEYLVRTRLARACELLQSTDGNVLDIAQAVGFSSLSYFNACFKRRYGVTPGRLRAGSRL